MSLLDDLRDHLRQRISVETEWLHTLLRQHGPAMLGRAREELLRAAWRRSLPSQLTLRTGYIADLTVPCLSRQTDILIADYQRHLPLFEEGELAVIPTAALRGAVEVKTNTAPGDLRDAFVNIACMKVLCPAAFGAICSFHVAQAGPNKLVRDVQAAITALRDDPGAYQPYEDARRPVYSRRFIADALCTLEVARRDKAAAEPINGYCVEPRRIGADEVLAFFRCRDPLAVLVQRFLTAIEWEEAEELYPREYVDSLLGEPFATVPLPSGSETEKETTDEKTG
jgi:hypothetical protein